MLNKVWSFAVIIAALATASILLLQPQLDRIVLLPDQGAAWYFWKRGDPTFLSQATAWGGYCLLYTSPSPRDGLLSRMPSSA